MSAGKTSASGRRSNSVPVRWSALLLLVGALVGFAVFGLQSRTTDQMLELENGTAAQSIADPENVDRAIRRGDTNSATTNVEAGRGFSMIESPVDVSIFGGTGEPVQRDRCNAAARNEMASNSHETDDGDVIVANSWWKTLTTSSRVGIARWLSLCTQDGRSVRIRSNESGSILAIYDPRTGYRADLATRSQL